MNEVKPLLAITMGDPAGVGPEISLQALHSKKVNQVCRPIIFGDVEILRRVGEATNQSSDFQVLSLDTFEGLDVDKIDTPTILDFSNIDLGDFQAGVISTKTGKASYQYIIKAIELANGGRVQGIATAPINKYALSLAGIDFPGHTEILEKFTESDDVCMLLTSDKISCALVTTHIGLDEVADALTESKIIKVIELTNKAMGRILGRAPKIGVLGLNPHCGESGLFGRNEESLIIEPAIKKAKQFGLDIEGPLSPDTAFISDNLDTYDAFVCMYHDQGLIPLKMLAFDSAVNVTLGLPIIRTSVDHGTALDIAWKGIAKSSSLIQSICLASLMCRSYLNEE
jgi:4-hydroxythreonine-4-phosphate dehydrogenase|tara:strand:+ start:4474 stop:5496 length:1023 start_codon:yes stop_codon:yes gene_type:complete